MIDYWRLVTPALCAGGAPTFNRAFGFRYYFTPLTGGLFTFPSRYLFTIGEKRYLALPDGPGSFRQDFTGPTVLKRRCSE